jgi:cell division protein FtsB
MVKISISDSVLDQDKEKLLEMPPAPPPISSPKPKALAIAAFVVGGIVYGVLRDEEGVMHVFRERSRLHDLSQSVNTLREENDRLRAEIEALRQDPRAVEKLAREELGLSMEGEVVFILEPEHKDPGR